MKNKLKIHEITTQFHLMDSEEELIKNIQTIHDSLFGLTDLILGFEMDLEYILGHLSFRIHHQIRNKTIFNIIESFYTIQEKLFTDSMDSKIGTILNGESREQIKYMLDVHSINMIQMHILKLDVLNRSYTNKILPVKVRTTYGNGPLINVEFIYI